MQGPPSGPEKPGAQRHALDDKLPADESEFSAHGVQLDACAAPVVDEYLPAGQVRHAVAPAVAEYVPALHRVHTALPVTDL